MPVLENSQYEIFCQRVAMGDQKKVAGLKAGFKPSNVKGRASMILRRPEVKARIKELKERNDKLIRKSIMSEMERRVRLSEFAGTNLVDFLDENGEVKINKKQKGIGALSEYTVKRRTIPGEIPIEEVTKTIKLRDPIASIDLLNKMDKVYSEQPQVNDNRHILNIIVVDNEAKDLIAQVKERTQKLIEG